MNQLYKWMIKSPSSFQIIKKPVVGAELCGMEKEEGKALDAETLSELISYALKCRDSSTVVLIALAGFCGLRRGEICGLMRGDIDWENGRIHVVRQRAEVHSSENGWRILTPKGGKEDGRTAGERKAILIMNLRSFFYGVSLIIL